MLWPGYRDYEGFYGSSFSAATGSGQGPVLYQGPGIMAQDYQNRAPSSGPTRNQRGNGFREAGPPYSYHLEHESSGTIAEDRSVSVNSGHAQIDASNNHSGVGKVWRTPSKNPLMFDCNLLT